MATKIIDRFDAYMAYKHLNDNKVTVQLGISNGTIGKSRKDGRDLSERVIEQILNFYTDLNREWLLYGEGEMLLSDPGKSADIVESAVIIGDAKPIPFVDRRMATAPNLNIRELVEKNSPLLELFPFAKMLEGVDYIQQVITMAMASRYMPGDYLFISFNEGRIMSGKIYLVDTKPYGTMLRHVYIEDDGYILKARNPEFKDVFVKYDDVYSISSVVLSVNTNTSLTSEINLADIVRMRDEQILSATSAQQRMLDAHDKLIDEIRLQNERIDAERGRTERERERTDKLIDKIINNNA